MGAQPIERIIQKYPRNQFIAELVRSLQPGEPISKELLGCLEEIGRGEDVQDALRIIHAQKRFKEIVNEQRKLRSIAAQSRE